MPRSSASPTNPQLAGAALSLRRKQLGLTLEDIAKRLRQAGFPAHRTKPRNWEHQVFLPDHQEEIREGYGFFNERVVPMIVLDSYPQCAEYVAIFDSAESFDRLSAPKTQVTIELSKTALHGALMEPMRITIRPGRNTGDLQPHSGEELVIVSEGQVSIRYREKDGSEREDIVSKGGLIHFHSDVPHCLSNPGPEDARLLVIKIPPDRYTQHTLRERAGGLPSEHGRIKRGSDAYDEVSSRNPKVRAQKRRTR
jgi:quercetin dioxygenase-like cupin family protein